MAEPETVPSFHCTAVMAEKVFPPLAFWYFPVPPVYSKGPEHVTGSISRHGTGVFLLDKGRRLKVCGKAGVPEGFALKQQAHQAALSPPLDRVSQTLGKPAVSTGARSSRASVGRERAALAFGPPSVHSAEPISG